MSANLPAGDLLPENGRVLVIRLSALGDVVHALAVRRQLAGIFAYREKRVAELFG